MGDGKQFFAPVPARAVADARLTGLHMKVLAAIAIHDRLSAPRKRGQGCWAGNKRLAEMIGCNYSNLSTALTGLATWGYIDRRQNPLNKKRRILFVVYNEQDAAIVGAKSDNDSLPRDKESAGIVCPDFQKSSENQSLGGGEYIPLKRGIDSAEAGEENSAETALLRDEDLPQSQRETARRLRETEAILKAMNGRGPTSDQFDGLLKAQQECWDAEDEFAGEVIGYWAQRLASEIAILVE